MNKNTEMVESANLYNKYDITNCGTSRVNVDPTTIIKDEPAFESIHYKLQTLNGESSQDKPKNGSVANKILLTNSDEGTDDGYLPAPLNLAKPPTEQTMFWGNSEILSQGNLFLQKDDWNLFNVWVPVSALAESSQASDLLTSLGVEATTNPIVESDSFIEFKCAIDSISLIAGKDLGLKTSL